MFAPDQIWLTHLTAYISISDFCHTYQMTYTTASSIRITELLQTSLNRKSPDSFVALFSCNRITEMCKVVTIPNLTMELQLNL